MNIIIMIIITTNLYHNVQVFVLNKSMLFYVTDAFPPTRHADSYLILISILQTKSERCEIVLSILEIIINRRVA